MALEFSACAVFGAVLLALFLWRGGGPIVFIGGIGTTIGVIAASRQVHTIRVYNDGLIEFVRLLGTTRVSVSDIVMLEGFRKNEYDGPVWKMRVTTWHTHLTVSDFPDVPTLLARICTIRPEINVRGEWPTLNPWGPDEGGTPL
jgi:hypothetical protein